MPAAVQQLQLALGHRRPLPVPVDLLKIARHVAPGGGSGARRLLLPTNLLHHGGATNKREDFLDWQIFL